VEHQLLKLDDVVEEQELQEQMLNERFQLAVYRSKKLKELEKINGIINGGFDVFLSTQFIKNVWF